MQPRKESGLDSACNICILETGPGFNDKDVIKYNLYIDWVFANYYWLHCVPYNQTKMLDKNIKGETT